jgi:protein arginine kinase activator
MQQCQVCAKNPASVHFTEIVNGKMSELHICDQCAHDKGIQPSLGKGKFWISDLIAGMVDETVGAESERVGRVQCSGCGLLYSAFRETGRLGCPDCYTSFGAQLRPMLRRIHGATRHIGKAPLRDAARLQQRLEVAGLHDELERAVEREDFEKAAELRDRIRTLELTPATGPEKGSEG